MKQEIIKLIEDIEDTKILKIIYSFVKCIKKKKDCN
ncbi:hypothetical protein CLOHAE12215_02584 [Clostridium haemolyticum]|nr:hypothetical protein CLOHAE12215_02584 [Clostridium haemolyticum]